MDARRTLGGKSVRDLEGVFGEDRLLGVVALTEADHFAVAEVDGRNDLQSGRYTLAWTRCLTKLSYSRRPISPLFSGWNCVATMLPRATTLAKRTP